jgi:hypothetical protein
MMKFFKLTLSAFLLTFSAGMFWFALGSLLGTNFGINIAVLSNEAHFIENVAIFSTSLCVLLGLWATLKKNPNWAFFSLWLTILSVREMDLHKSFTSDSFLKMSFYLSTEIPIGEKFFGIVFIAFIIFMAILTIRVVNYRRLSWLSDKYANLTLIALSGIFMIVTGKFIDSSPRIFPALVRLFADNPSKLGFIEEGLETTGTLFFLLFIICVLRSQADHAVPEKVKPY